MTGRRGAGLAALAVGLAAVGVPGPRGAPVEAAAAAFPTTGRAIVTHGSEDDVRVTDHRGPLYAQRAWRVLHTLVRWVSDAKPAPRLLYVGVAGQGMRDAGYRPCGGKPPTSPGCYDIALEDGAWHDPADGPRHDLHRVVFGDYDAVVVWSDDDSSGFVGDVRVLEARRAELLAYVNAGGGLLAFHAGQNSTLKGVTPYAYLPCMAGSTEQQHTNADPYKTTAAGRDMGLRDEDFQRHPTADYSGYFRAVGGWTPIILDSHFDGARIAAMAAPDVVHTCGLSVDDPEVVEGDSGTVDLVFTLTLDGAVSASQSVSVEWETAPGSATAGVDYHPPARGRVVFPAGTRADQVVRRTVRVPVVGDTAIEGDETVLVRLSNPVNSWLFDPEGTGTIVDDDRPGPPTTTPGSSPRPPGGGGQDPGGGSDEHNRGGAPGGGSGGGGGSQSVAGPQPGSNALSEVATGPAPAGEFSFPPAEVGVPVPSPVSGGVEAPAAVAPPAPAGVGAPNVLVAPEGVVHLAPQVQPQAAAQLQPGVMGERQREIELEAETVGGRRRPLLASEVAPAVPVVLAGVMAAMAAAVALARPAPRPAVRRRRPAATSRSAP